MLIYLVGYMGSGKTTVGKKIARKLGYDFTDLDQLIEETYNYTIPDIFNQFDEHAFRLLEQKTLHTTFGFKNTVIATGGGAPCFYDNMEQINKHGISIYLSMSTAALVNRLLSAKKKRPLILEKNREEVMEFIKGHLKERKAYYQKATIHVDGVNFQTDALYREINGFIKKKNL